WIMATLEQILDFSAVGYFFARTLFDKYKVPIGLINASVGGTPVEAWLSEEALQAFPESLAEAHKFKDESVVNAIKEQDEERNNKWYEHITREDKGLNGDIKWHDPNFDASKWPTMSLPAYWEDEGLPGVNGVVWFRKEIDVPASMTGKPARL